MPATSNIRSTDFQHMPLDNRIAETRNSQMQVARSCGVLFSLVNTYWTNSNNGNVVRPTVNGVSRTLDQVGNNNTIGVENPLR
ncbi:MAG: hypothetical protein ABI811_19575 [Acidobacteriota bacterium]